MKKVRRHPPRKGPFALDGKHRDQYMATVYVRNVKPKTPRRAVVIDRRSIAEIYGSNSPELEMSAMRERWKRWELRKIAQRQKAKVAA